MARVYADSTAYAAAGNTPPTNVDYLLRQASRAVDQLLTGRVYDTDPDTGMPTDADDVQAMSDATVAIAAEAAATGALEAGGTETYDTVSIGNVSLTTFKSSSDVKPTVLGIPVPAAAVVALADVGTLYVYVGTPGCPRPLDRITP